MIVSYWVKRLIIPGMVLWVLERHDGLWALLEHEVFVFDDPGERHVLTGVVHLGYALIVAVHDSGIEAERAVLKLSEPVVIVFVHLAGVDDLAGEFVLVGQVVHASLYLDIVMVEHVLEHPGIAVNRNTLEAVVEVAVVVGKPDRQPVDDGRRKLGRVTAPLLGRVTFDEEFVEFFADLGNAPLPEILRVVARFSDRGQLVFSLLRSNDTPDLVKGYQVDGKGI